MNCPEQALSTSFWGKGAVSGDKLNPGLGRWARQWASMATPTIVAADEGNASSGGASSSGTETSAVAKSMTPKHPMPVGLPKIEG